MPIQTERYQDNRLAINALLLLVAVVGGLLSAGLAMFFEAKIVLGLVIGGTFALVILLRPLVGILFLIATMPVLEIFPATFFGTGLLNPTNLIMGLTALSIALYRGLLKRKGPARGTFTLPIMIYGAALAFSIVMAGIVGWSTSAGVAENLRTYLNGVFLFVLAMNVIEEDKHALWILYAVVFSVIFVCLWGLFEYRSDIIGGVAAGRVRISGRVGQPNSFGAYCCYYLPFVLMVARMSQVSKLLRMVCWGGAVAVVFCLIFTQSRGAYLALVAMLLFLGVAVNRKVLLVMLLAGSVYPLWLPSTAIDRMNHTFQEDNETGLDNSSESRIIFYKAGLRMFAESPIWGHGFDGFRHLVQSSGVTETKRAAHSLYIQTLADSGIIGMSSLLFLWFYLFRRGRELWTKAKDPTLRLLGEAYLGVVIAMVMVNVFGIRFYNFTEIGYFWCLNAVLVWFVMRERERRAADSAAGRAPA
jgi:O-antigen ligase